GKATIDVMWEVGGQHEITATFTPDSDPSAMLESPASLYRVVDPSWHVDMVELGADALALDPATTSFTWSFGNYYLEFFQSGFTKEAIGDNVLLYPADTAAGVDNDPIGTMSDDTNAEFQFTNGMGHKDSQGNVAVDFTGIARVKSGDMLFWDFKDPQVRIGADGHGYVTAELTDSWADPDRQGVRVLVGEFETSDGPNIVTAGISTQAAGETWRHYMKPKYADHTAAGTWAADFTGSYPNEMLANMAEDGRAFWYDTGSSSDAFKPPHQMMLQYEDVEEAEEPEPDPTEPPAPQPTTPVPPEPKLPITGANSTALALLMVGVSGAGALLIRRKFAR
ncbi:MAG: LPXTG cell wall anchor domain-containing protein, partial [Bowdeniella nasicola]|nr:LPXTG cell wall anchor domain-containing protein [Bowdeniella nasicola]